MDAVVTLKVSPQEFDDIRWALEKARASEDAYRRDTTVVAELREKARHRMFRLDELLRKVS